MSETEIYAVVDDGYVYYQCGLRNSWRGAMNIWNELSRKWFGWDNFPIMNVGDRTAQKVWDLHEDDRLSLNDRIVLKSTFDRAMVRVENIERLAVAMEDFATRYEPGSLIEHAKALRNLAWLDGCLAVCWNQTSVNCNPWQICDDEDCRAYNIHTSTEHWFIFDEIENEN